MPRARAVLRALNAPGRAPVVLACRQLDYHEISQPTPGQAGGVSILTDARHVTLRPLDAPDVISYLTDRFRGRDGGLRPRWQPVADALTTGDPLAQILANPWQLFLAVTAYTAEDSDPAELLIMSPDHAETHLLAALVPAVVAHDDTAARYGWTPERVTHWLATIADHQYRAAIEHGSSPIDIRLPDLWRIARRRYPRWVPALLAATPLLALGIRGQFLATDLAGRVLAVVIMLLAAAMGLVAYSSASPMQRLDLDVVRTRHGRRRLRKNLKVGLEYMWYIALTFVLALALVTIPLRVPVAVGTGWSVLMPLAPVLVVGLAVVLVGGLRVDVETAPSMTALVRQCVTYSLAVGLAGGLAGWGAGMPVYHPENELALGPTYRVAYELAFGPAYDSSYVVAYGLAYALAGAVVGGLAYGNGTVWLRYVLGVRGAVRQGDLPRRPARFCDWCLGTGLMRMTGNSLQFRHRQLQDWLVLHA